MDQVNSKEKNRSRSSFLEGCSPWPQEMATKYKALGYWKDETFTDVLQKSVVRNPEGTALVCGERRWSYRELLLRSEKLGAGFHELGIKANDRVVVQLPNCAEFFAVCFALFRLGALPVFALPAHRRNEVSFFCEFSKAVAYIIPDQYGSFDYRMLAREVKAAVDTLHHVIVVGEAEEFIPLDRVSSNPIQFDRQDPDNVAFFQLSGGTTGTPKLIPRTHNDYIYSIQASIEICRFSGDTVYLVALPAAHNFPLSSPGTLGALFAGGTVVLAPYPSPDVAFPLIEKEKVTVSALVPSLAIIWLNSSAVKEYDLSSLQMLQVGGSKLSAEIARQVKPVLNCRLQQVFGMAEGLVNYTRCDDPDDVVIHTQGRPISADDEIRIWDEDDLPVANGEIGNLLTRGPYTIRGYYHAEAHNAKSFTKDGFYRTGDLVRLTADGNLIVEGRSKDQINRGGDKIAAEEVENALLGHPVIVNAALVAMPDQFLGERSCAFLMVKSDPPKPMELKQFLRKKGLAEYKIPDRFEFTKDLPLTHVGKISKKKLRAIICQKLNSAERLLKFQ